MTSRLRPEPRAQMEFAEALHVFKSISALACDATHPRQVHRELEMALIDGGYQVMQGPGDRLTVFGAQRADPIGIED